jgi:hypothetical protein
MSGTKATETKEVSTLEAEIDSYLEDYEMVGEDEHGRECRYTPNGVRPRPSNHG